MAGENATARKTAAARMARTLSTLLGSYLADTLHWNEYLVTFLNMVLNLVTEYVYDRLVVYRGAVDTARRPEEQPAEDCQ